MPLDVSINNINVDIDENKVNVTFGLHTVEDDYIGLLFSKE